MFKAVAARRQMPLLLRWSGFGGGHVETSSPPVQWLSFHQQSCSSLPSQVFLGTSELLDLVRRGLSSYFMSWMVTACSVLSIKAPFAPTSPEQTRPSAGGEWAVLEGRADVETAWLPSYLLFVEQLKGPRRCYAGRSVPFEKQTVRMSDVCPSAWREGR